jgi:hypothetical protein
MPSLPEPRGHLSEFLLGVLAEPAAPIDPPTVSPPADPLADEDLQLTLYCCYELHYRGFDDVDEAWEWEPSLLAFRRTLEQIFEHALIAEIGPPSDTVAPDEMDLALRAILEADEAPSLSRYIERHATLAEVHEFLIHRSAYQLKEADPHSFAIPRLSGPPKAAMVEIQADEYGGGRADRVHAVLFAKTLAALGLDATYGAYLDHIPGYTLATVNLMSLLGLHRRWRGAITGHLALFEMSSSLPNGRYARGLRRLSAPEEAIDFFDEHVVADAVHENIAAVDLAGGLARAEPAVTPDILWGARTLVALEARQARTLLSAWDAGVSSLRREAAAPQHSAP